MKKTFSFILASAIAILTVVSCGGGDSPKEPQGGTTPPKEVEPTQDKEYSFTAQSGWDIYQAGTYRYGPSIIINDDGSIDAWFAAAGSTFAADAGEVFYQGGNTIPINLGSTDVAVAFTIDKPMYGLQACCPTWSTHGTESMTMWLFLWDTDYRKTVTGTPVFMNRYEKMEDNAWFEIVKEDGTKFEPGRYLLLLGEGSSKAGVWFYPEVASLAGRDIQAYQSGSPCSGTPQVILNYDSPGGLTGSYWDQVSYQHSTDGGRTWTKEEMVLKPTRGTRDELSCCDPGVIKIGDYYYLGYTSTEHTGGLENHLFMARGKSPKGPWEKWNGEGWGGEKVEPVVTYSGAKGQWGVGEPSMVVLDGTLYLYYSWNDNSTTTRVATAPADDPLWPAKLSLKGTAIDKSGIRAADHSDVKYCDAMKQFIAVHTAERMTSGSYIQIWTSSDGLSFQKKSRLTGNLGKGLHNIGISGDPLGHIDVEKQQYIGYAYGLDASGNSSWGKWNTMWNPLKISK